MWRGSNVAVRDLIIMIQVQLHAYLKLMINAGFITEMALESQSVMDAADKYLLVRL